MTACRPRMGRRKLPGLCPKQKQIPIAAAKSITIVCARTTPHHRPETRFNRSEGYLGANGRELPSHRNQVTSVNNITVVIVCMPAVSPRIVNIVPL